MTSVENKSLAKGISNFLAGGKQASYQVASNSNSPTKNPTKTHELPQPNPKTMPPQNPILVTPSSTLGSNSSGAQTQGMTRQNALVNVSSNICATRMIAAPHTASAIHHHGEENTIVFAFSGQGTIVSEGGKKKQVLMPGDFALIPAWAEHQEVNETDEEVVWAIVRSGREPVVVNLDEEGGWGSSV